MKFIIGIVLWWVHKLLYAIGDPLVDTAIRIGDKSIELMDADK